MNFKFNFLIIFIFVLIFSITLTAQEKEDLSLFLKPTWYINSDHPDIIKKAKVLTRNCETKPEKARVLYEFVRDFNTRDREYESFKASDVLKVGGMGCFPRSILLAALCRSVGIPARVNVQKVTLVDRRKVEGEYVDSVFLHGIMSMYLKGGWHLYDTEGYEWKWVFWTRDENRASEMPLEFYPDRDCLLKNTDKTIFETLLIYFIDWDEEVYENRNNIFKCMLAEDNSVFLKSGECVDSDNPKIIKKMKELTKNKKTDAEKVKALYEYVRDSYNDNRKYESYKASYVLDIGGNNCIQRSILLTALCRAAGIPARIHMLEFEIEDYKFDNGEVGDIKSPHVISEIYINEKWHLYEATGNEKKWVGLNRDVQKYASDVPLKFYPDRDCIFKSNENVKFKDTHLYFDDWSDLHLKFLRKAQKGEIGFLY